LLIGVIIVAALLFVGHGIVLGKAGRYLLKKDELKPADVIVVLAGEETERIEYGVKLFKEEWARKNRVIMSGGPVVGRHTSASLMKEYAEYLGVPGKYILTQDRSRSTEEDALYTRELLGKNGYKSMILVTSPYHSARAALIFKRIMGDRVRVISAPCDKSWFNFDEWWKRRRDRDTVLSEFSKYIRIWIFGVSKGDTSSPAED
jgi:uncharacterized SAM-binding protein YcdF (DUF218 family)